MVQYEKVLELWNSFHISTPSELDLHLDSFRVLFAYHSGKIENDEVTYRDTREVFQDGHVHSFQGNPRTLFEIQNQKDCYLWLLPRVFSKKPLTVELVKEMHRILTAGTYDEHRFLENEERPGEFKRHEYVTGIYEVGSPPEQVETHISSLLFEVNEAVQGVLEPEKLLRIAAYLHACFEFIHPFADGNGRVGRALVNFFLMANGHPPLVVYEDDRTEYYMALQAYDEKEAIKPLPQLFQAQVIKTWEKALARQEGARPLSRKQLDEIQ